MSGPRSPVIPGEATDPASSTALHILGHPLIAELPGPLMDWLHWRWIFPYRRPAMRAIVLTEDKVSWDGRHASKLPCWGDFVELEGGQDDLALRRGAARLRLRSQDQA